MTVTEQEDGVFRVILPSKQDKKEWLAKLVGLDEKYIFERSFVNRVGREKKESVYEIVEDGVYEAEDKDGRHYFAKQGDKIVELDRDSAKEMLRDQPNDEVPDELDIPF